MIGNVFTYGASSHGVASELLTAQGLEVMGIKGSVVTSSANGIYPVSHNPSCIDEAVLHDLNVLARKSPIVQLSMNKLHGVALTSLGSVFTFGAAEDGRLGRSVSRNRVDAVTKLDKYKIVAVAVGESHSAAVTGEGELGPKLPNCLVSLLPPRLLRLVVVLPPLTTLTLQMMALCTLGAGINAASWATGAAAQPRTAPPPS